MSSKTLFVLDGKKSHIEINSSYTLRSVNGIGKSVIGECINTIGNYCRIAWELNSSQQISIWSSRKTPFKHNNWNENSVDQVKSFKNSTSCLQ